MTLLDTHVWLRWIIEGVQSLPSSMEEILMGEDLLAVSSMLMLGSAVVVTARSN